MHTEQQHNEKKKEIMEKEFVFLEVLSLWHGTMKLFFIIYTHWV